jgi:predicted MFS family arabinose efflux permease
MSDSVDKQNFKPLLEKPSEGVFTAAYIKTLVSCTACWYLAQMSYYAQAQLYGPIMERFSMGELEVGIMFTQELTVFALTALIVAGPLSRVSRIRAACTGCIILLTANLVAASTESFDILKASRLVAGFAGGLIGAAGTASAASSVDPQRVFAIVGVAWGLIGAAMLVVTPYFTVPFGSAGGYYAMAGAVVLMVPAIIWLNAPRIAEMKEDEDTQQLGFFARFTERLGVRGAPNARFALFAMGALFIYEIGQGATQVFLEQFGLRTGLDQYRIGEILGVAAFLGLSGGMLAAWMGNRFGNTKPIVIGLILNFTFASTLALGTLPILFAASYLGWNIAYYFLVPFMLGALAEMDDRGRWVVATDAVWWLGAAPGAAVGGLLVEAGGYNALAVLSPITGMICIAVLTLTLRRFNQIRESLNTDEDIIENRAG